MKHNRCRIIGLTGGIASGKSTVSKILVEKGFIVIDADKIAKIIVEKGRPAYKEIVDLFGNSILLEDKSIDRRALATIVFSNSGLLKKLNQITHPRIYEKIREEIFINCRESKIIFLDIPLIFEEKDKINQANIHFDQIWLVYVDENKQIERLKSRNSLSKKEALKRIRLQIPIEEKKALADLVIDNSKSLTSLREQVDSLTKNLS